jgi:protein-disulfide isomerase
MAPLPDSNVSPDPSRSKKYLGWGIFLLAGLLVGAAFGYRVGQAQRGPIQVVVTATPGSGDQALADAGASAAGTPADDSQSALPKSLMDVVLSDTRHFQGSPDAPVTMIEFSDFK